MNWELAATVLVALAGLGATVLTAAQARRHAERLAAQGYRRERAERVRQDRLGIYANALAHAVDQERSLNKVWAYDGDSGFELTPQPAGAPLSLASMDEITVRMRLVADEDVEAAWAEFVRARDGYYFWGNVEGGPPDEGPPETVVQPLRAAIDALKLECRRSLEQDEELASDAASRRHERAGRRGSAA